MKMRRNTIEVIVALLMVIILSATIIPNSFSATSTTKLEKETIHDYPRAIKAKPPEGIWTDAPYSVPAPLKTAPVFKAGMHAPSTTGTLKALVLMIEFTDQPHDPAHDATYFDTMLFSTTDPGSMRNYYLENSYGLTTVTGDVHPVWLASSKTMSWYGADSTPGGDDANGNIYELAREAVQLADTAVDFSQYDADSDGVVDHLIIVHAGPDQADTGNPNHIWSHRWMIQPSELTAEGVYAEGYTMQAETCLMGVFAHEFGHDLGLPDLYDRDYTSWGVGFWCIMGFGTNLPSPAHFSGWCKFKLGWITPTTITAATTGAIVNQIETSATQSLYKVPITTGSDVEYFLIENRQQTGYDQFLPGSGVLVWHIDERQWITQNDDENHKLVDLEEADGLNHIDLRVNGGDATDPWYSNPTGFTGTSNPNSNSYSGAPTGIEVNNISPSSATMTVDFEATQGWTQIAYDDGDPETGWTWNPGCMFAVRFTPSTSGQLKTASFFVGDPAAIKVHVLDASRNDLIAPLTRTPTSMGWFDVDLSAQSITVSTAVDFYIGMEFISTHIPWLGYDENDPDDRSWDWDGASWTGPWADGDYMIRAVVQPTLLQIIMYDDGELDGAWSIDSWRGHCVLFTAPTVPWFLDAVRIYGQRYGEDREFFIEIWDADRNDLLRIGPFAYSQYFSTDFAWAEIPVGVSVTGDFYICVFASSTPTTGVYIGYDADPPHDQRSYIVRSDTNEIMPWTITPPREEMDWMIRALGHTPPLVGLLNFDDYRNRMGSVTPMEPSTTFYFAHFHQDSSWQTFVAIANPNDQQATVTLTFYRDDGSTLETENFNVPSNGKQGFLLSSLGVTGTGWIKVESNLPVVGLLNFDDYANRMGSMSGVTPASTIYFPHFHQDVNWQTYYAIVNPSNIAASITITYYGADGSVLSTESLTLSPRNKIGRFAVSGTGWIAVQSNQPMVGMLNFDDYHNRMGTIEHAVPSTTLYFPHFHQDAYWQTFYAIVNPSTSDATVTITYYGADGTIIQSSTIGLNAHSKYGTFAVSGTGWIKVESTVPIVGILNFDDYHNRMGSIVAARPFESIVFPHFHQDASWQTFYAVVNLGPSATFTSTYYGADGSIITSTSTTIDTNSKIGQFATSGTGWLKVQ